MRCPAELKSDKPLLWSPGTGRQVWAMLLAAREGDLPALRRLLKQNPALAQCHFEYRTPSNSPYVPTNSAPPGSSSPITLTA